MLYPLFTTPVGPHHYETDVSAIIELQPFAGANAVQVQCETQNCRYTLDGTAPSATAGFLIVASALPIILPLGTQAIQILEAAGGAVLNYQYLHVDIDRIR